MTTEETPIQPEDKPVKKRAKKAEFNFKPEGSPKGWEKFVWFYLTELDANKPTDVRKQQVGFVPPRTLMCLRPHEFMQAFGNNLTNNGRFQNVNTPGKVYSIIKHMDEKLFERRFRDLTRKWEDAGIIGAAYEKRLKEEMDIFIRIGVAGSQQVIMDHKDIVYIPSDDQEFVNKLPDNV